MVGEPTDIHFDVVFTTRNRSSEEFGVSIKRPESSTKSIPLGALGGPEEDVKGAPKGKSKLASIDTAKVSEKGEVDLVKSIK